MATSLLEARTENAAQLGALGLRPTQVTRLLQLARMLHRLAEAQCNGFQTWDGKWDEAAEKRADRREARLLAEAQKIAAPAFRVYQQGDPRGWPLYLIPEHYPAAEDATNYSGRGVAVCPH